MLQQDESKLGRLRDSRLVFTRDAMARKMKSIALCTLFLALLAPLGCTSPKPRPPPPSPPVAGYVVGAPDILLVHILPEPEIEREVTVRPDGKISVDLVGDIQAAGRSPLEIAREIQETMGRFKRDAVVSVSVVSSPSQFVTIYGEVARPGLFALDASTRVSEAIGRVGGALPFAKLGGVRLIRTTHWDWRRSSRRHFTRLQDIFQR